MTQRDGRGRLREKEPKKEMRGGGKRDEESERWNKRTKRERDGVDRQKEKELTKRKEGGEGERGRDGDKWTTKRYILTAEED